MIVELQEWQIFLPSRNWIGAFLEQQLRLLVVLVQCEFVLWQRLSLLLLQKPSCLLLLLETMKIKGGIIRGKIWCQGLRISPCPRFWEFWECFEFRLQVFTLEEFLWIFWNWLPCVKDCDEIRQFLQKNFLNFLEKMNS